MNKYVAPTSSTGGDGRRDRTRARIIDAAYAVFAREGYDAVRVEQILIESNVARATFYAHFADKQQVALAIIERMWVRAETLYAEFAALPSLDPTTVRAWLAHVADVWACHYQEVALIISQLPEHITTGLRGHEERLVDLLIGDGKHWPFSTDENRCRASLLIFMLERAMLETFSAGWTVERSLFLDTLSSIWLRTLGVADANMGHEATT